MYFFDAFLYRCNFLGLQKNFYTEFLSLEKKTAKDLLNKKGYNFLDFDVQNPQLIHLDRESKVLGYKKNFNCTQQKRFLPFSENKKFLKSTIFGAVRFLHI